MQSTAQGPRGGSVFSTRRNERSGLRSQRSVVLARHGMVCTSQPLASVAALDVLRSGGNAVDAAVTAAAALGVVEPFMTGIGGDCFMLIWCNAEQRLYGLNGSGRAPAAATLEAYQGRGLAEVPLQGILSVTVPGAVDAWHSAVARFGRRSLAAALEPAIGLAEEGFPLSEIIGFQWSWAARAGALQNDAARRAFTVDGEPPAVGAICRLPDLAASLRLLASAGREVLYGGDLARRIVTASAELDGLLSVEDFAAHESTWVEPISTDYRGHRLYELPPNGQGLTALIALNILENFDLAAQPADGPETAHLRIEALKLAFADRDRYIADPEHAKVPVAALLSKDYAHGRAALIQRHKALPPPRPGTVRGGDTVYLTVADADGNVVSLINSLYGPFGSGIVAGDTGIALQNRGRGFSLDPAHPNCIAPHKRPFHTIIPAMLFHDGRPLVSFGVMGGDVQPQGHLQVVSNLVDYGFNIQEGLDAPRFNYLGGIDVAFEDVWDQTVRDDVSRRGHRVLDEWAAILKGGFGGGQGIAIDPASGVYWGGSDRRKDGCAIGW